MQMRKREMSQGRVPCHQDRRDPAAGVDVVVVGVGEAAAGNAGAGAGDEDAVGVVVVEGSELLEASTSQTWH
jgi:hypothetical protein